MARQDELLQQIAAASVPHRLGRVYSRYGQPAPVLGDERGALRTLGRDRPKAPQAAGLAGRPGSSQQDARDAEADDIAAKYEDLPDTADEQKAREEQDQHDYEELSDTQRGIVDQYA